MPSSRVRGTMGTKPRELQAGPAGCPANDHEDRSSGAERLLTEGCGHGVRSAEKAQSRADGMLASAARAALVHDREWGNERRAADLTDTSHERWEAWRALGQDANWHEFTLPKKG